MSLHVPALIEKKRIGHRSFSCFWRRASGVVNKMDAESIGRASLLLGARRQKADDAIDFVVGLSARKKIGESVARDEPLMSIHARS
jgi:thymidine phosphorylase